MGYTFSSMVVFMEKTKRLFIIENSCMNKSKRNDRPYAFTYLDI